MSKLIWQLYHDNMISEEVAGILLDKLYDRLNNKRYKWEVKRYTSILLEQIGMGLPLK